MKEGMQIALIVGFFVIAGLFVFFQGSSYTEFNFNKVELTVSENHITEKLYFEPDKSYHTLYRNFNSPVYSFVDSPSKINYVQVQNVVCSSGNAYVKNDLLRCTYFSDKVASSSCIAYTEKNEYGCGFGSTYGFFKGNTYTIESVYDLHPENLFLIEGKYYIKFVVYAQDKHVNLNKNNFLVSGGAVKKQNYASDENVIIYIPYSGDISGYKILKQNNFEYDNNLLETIFTLLINLLPAILLFSTWKFFGKEKTYEDIPNELSFYPKERNPWEVAAFFQPPFNLLDKNFFATMLINFYHRKIIDIKMKKKDVMIKINEYKNKTLDSIEKDFLLILESLFTENPAEVIKKDGKYRFEESMVKFERNFFSGLFGKTSYIENGYLNLNKALKSWKNQSYIRLSFNVLHSDVKKIGKNYIDSKGKNMVIALVIIFAIIFKIFGSFISGINIYSFLLYFAMIWAFLIFSRSALFIKFNEHYYKEYQRWQAYRRFLKNSFSIKEHGYKGVILWDKILIYATALGVAKQVLKQMKKIGVIDDRNFALYTGIYVSSTSFSASTGSAGGSGGGFGGAGGGGIGGGGGGGR